MAAAFGAAVAGARDVNGDGLSDLLVGAPKQDGSTSSQGQVFVFSGADGLRSRRGPMAASSLTLDNLTLAGDMNRDGRADLLVGAPGQRVGGVAIRVRPTS